jgi:DNA (cytosine-5)-methyltransferase 1
MGYHRAGFDVVGVDIAAQPRYPFEFHQGDAMTWPLDGYDAVHASPPCQADSQMTNCRPGVAATYPRLIGPTRERLQAWGGPWVIENVDGAGLPGQADLFGADGLMLCGFMFGLRLYRHRFFETSQPIRAPHHPRHLIPASKAGHWEPGTIMSVEGNFAPVAEARAAMGIDWANRAELGEAIPPAYTEYIGGQLMDVVGAGAGG